MLEVLVDMPADPGPLHALGNLPDVRVTQIPWRDKPGPLPAELVHDTQVMFCTYPPANIGDCRALQWVQIGSAGYTQLMNIGLAERGVRATNALGVFDVPIAEWNIGMLFQLARDMRGMFHNQERGRWDRSARFQAELRGATVGLWGYGGIARETARLCKALGLHVHALVREQVKPRVLVYCVPGTGDPHGTLPDRVFTGGQEAEFLGGLDFLILCMPLTKHTEGIVGERELRALPATAFVLNPARGPLIQEDALLRALRDGWIAGAALDAHHHYPMPPEHPLWGMPNVIMTPHISGSALSPHYKARTWAIFLENLARFQSQQPLLNELSAHQLMGG